MSFGPVILRAAVVSFGPKDLVPAPVTLDEVSTGIAAAASVGELLKR